MCAKCHAFSETGDNEGISNGKEGKILRERQVLCMEEDDWLIRERRKPGVDTRHEIRNTALQLVLLCC